MRRRPGARGRYSRFPWVNRWEGCVTDVEGDEFAAELIPLSYRGQTLVAIFDRTHLTGAFPGQLFFLNTRRFGNRQARTTIQRRRMRPWTAEEIDEIQRLARERMARLQGLAA